MGGDTSKFWIFYKGKCKSPDYSCILTQMALLDGSVITTDELEGVTDALLQSDSEDSSDGDYWPITGYCSSSDSEISVTRISPVKEGTGESVMQHLPTSLPPSLSLFPSPSRSFPYLYLTSLSYSNQTHTSKGTGLLFK